MNDLVLLIQKDPELYEIIEQLKSNDETLEDFILNVANMLSIEFEYLHRSDLADKLSALFGGLPPKAFAMVPTLVHVALDIFLLKAIPNHTSIRD